MQIISIVGNTNVGKSTLFNKFVPSFQKAITSNLPGVTRDYKMAEAQLSNLKFKLIDTGGLSLKICNDENLNGKINRQTIMAVAKSNLILFIVDGVLGITEQDRSIAVWLKKQGIPVILVVNKTDIKQTVDNFYEFYQLGYKDLCAISAEHNLGFNVLYELIDEKIKAALCNDSLGYAQDRALKIAIIGRPNVGKSTLVNAFLSEERVIADQEAGITRDSVFIDMVYKKHKIQLIDTAGIRKHSKIANQIERLSIKKSRDAINICDIAVLILDANAVFKKQDLKLASIILQEEIKPLVVVVNKIDLIKMNLNLRGAINYEVRTKLPQVTKVKTIYISALKRKNINKIFDECITLHELYSMKIPTSKLNHWLGQAIDSHQPPLSKLGRKMKIKFISQIGSSPPSFQIFSNYAQEIPIQYMRYLTRSLQNHFKLYSIPIKICKMKAKNPYKHCS